MELMIKNVNGLNVVSSRTVAEQLGKDNSDVKKKIKEVLESGTEYFPTQILVRGKEAEDYLLTKEGFILLCMNYTGYNDFKRAYINEFNRMEQALVTKTDSYMIQDPIERAKAWIVEAEEKKELELKVEKAKPKVVYYDKVLNSEKLITVTDIAKDFGMSAIKLNSFLQEIGVQYKQSGSWKLYANHENKVPEYADYVINEYGQSLRWTELGRQWILELIATKNNVNKIGSIAV
ncbi:MAG: phage antirepressor KilAC domain-containing protein [Fusobacteriaceae bacterium]